MDVERNGKSSPQGLTREEAETRLRQYGPNAVRQGKAHPFLAIAKEFWAPVPWMLEATIVLELILGKRPEAIIIGFLLIFNAALGFVQENRAQNALALLRQRLPVKARVLREGQWQLLPAEDLVPGDFIHLRMGDVMPADVRLADGNIQLDQSTLTGESLPVEAGSGRTAFAGSVVIHDAFSIGDSTGNKRPGFDAAIVHGTRSHGPDTRAEGNQSLVLHTPVAKEIAVPTAPRESPCL